MNESEIAPRDFIFGGGRNERIAFNAQAFSGCQQTHIPQGDEAFFARYRQAGGRCGRSERRVARRGDSFTGNRHAVAFEGLGILFQPRQKRQRQCAVLAVRVQGRDDLFTVAQRLEYRVAGQVIANTQGDFAHAVYGERRQIERLVMARRRPESGVGAALAQRFHAGGLQCRLAGAVGKADPQLIARLLKRREAVQRFRQRGDIVPRHHNMDILLRGGLRQNFGDNTVEQLR